MKVLIIGSGGREHALAWKIKQSPIVEWVGVAPGNGGTDKIAVNIQIDPSNLEQIRKYVLENEIRLVVVGPEAPLADGIADLFSDDDVMLFGPSGEAAQIEANKRFSKEVMMSAGIPTATYESFVDINSARSFARSRRLPMVIKASGLAAGKGVFICDDHEAAIEVVEMIMGDKIFGDSGSELIIEDCLEGPEVSVLAVCDGDNYLLLPPSQDHKRQGEGDTGPNTGGMGAYCPTPFVDSKLMQQIGKDIIAPALDEMKKRGHPYKGILYAGLMMTENGPMVLEFNCRFGDPETEAVLPLIKADIVELMIAACKGQLDSWMQKNAVAPHEWEKLSHNAWCGTIIMASGGYPGAYEKGKEIVGIPSETPECVVFHAGTKSEDNRIFSSGGRVLAVSGIGETLIDALANAYKATDQISFENSFYRNDIGWRALNSH